MILRKGRYYSQFDLIDNDQFEDQLTDFIKIHRNGIIINLDENEKEYINESIEDGTIQNRWILYIYTKTRTRAAVMEVIDDIIPLYSLNPGEYDLYLDDPCACEPISNLLKSALEIRLTKVEIEILTRSVFRFSDLYIDSLRGIPKNKKDIIMAKEL